MNNLELLIRLRGKVFKILPVYEEKGDWEYFRDLAVIELRGLEVAGSTAPNLYRVRCKLSGLNSDISDKAFRSVILRCSSLLSEVIENEQSI